MKPARASTQIVGNIGLYYAAYRLSTLGWNIMPTSRNARGIDLLAYDIGAEHFLGIQIKTLSKRNAVPLGTDLARIAGDWWIIVTSAASAPICFILKPTEVTGLSLCNEKDGRRSYWLEPRYYAVDHYREAWDRIGRGDRIAVTLGEAPQAAARSGTTLDDRTLRTDALTASAAGEAAPRGP